VAIIAILVAIAIPMFSSSLKKTKEATCAANRRSLKAELSVTLMSDGESAVEGKYNEVIGKYTCPEGGKIEYHIGNDNTVTVTCSIHNNPRDVIDNALNKNSIDLTFGTRLDSYDPSKTEKTAALKKYFTDALTSAGANVNSSGGIIPNSWAIVKTTENVSKKDGSGAGTLLIWSDRDIKNYTVSTPTPAVCYNIDTGRYTVGLSNASKKGGNFNILGNSSEVSGFGTDKSNVSKSFSTFDEAKKYYDELNSKN
jgi:Tfp pilus assembly major pilin PilA